jgi:hypothetical protein
MMPSWSNSFAPRSNQPHQRFASGIQERPWHFVMHRSSIAPAPDTRFGAAPAHAPQKRRDLGRLALVPTFTTAGISSWHGVCNSAVALTHGRNGRNFEAKEQADGED